MNFPFFQKIDFSRNGKFVLLFLPLLALPVALWLLRESPAAAVPDPFSPEKINLALRRTADGLLRRAGDSTSRIPAILPSADGRRWRVRLDRSFSYDSLPALLEASLRLHGIRQPYEVAVRQCSDETIDLGYHQRDFLEKTGLPCGGRELPEGCRFLEVIFLEKIENQSLATEKLSGLLLLVAAAAVFLFFKIFKKRKTERALTPAAPPLADGWLAFGKSQFDPAGQILICGGERQQLTFREAKLLQLFAENVGQLLERELILQKIWADEGVLVGRSVDVFVSRLRKKLAADPSVGIVAVHGVGYRMEVVG